jgi:hypothetical protein
MHAFGLTDSLVDLVGKLDYSGVADIVISGSRSKVALYILAVWRRVKLKIYCREMSARHTTLLLLSKRQVKSTYE